MELEVAVLSRRGGRDVNEDAAGVWSEDGVCVCVLADGVGGHGAGDVASKLVVRQTLESLRACTDRNAVALATALESSNNALFTEQRRDARLAVMRATVVVLMIDTCRDIAVWAHLGDSRLYCFRQGILAAQTRDHSVVQSMVDAGYLKRGDLRKAPGRSKLLAALGDQEGFDPDIAREEFSLQHGDKFLLCTDGFWEYVEEELMQGLLPAATSAEHWLREMEAYILAHGVQNQDNYSGIAVWCSDADRGI